MPFRHHFVGSAIKIEAAKKIGQPLAIVLVPDNGPLRKKIAGIGVSRAVWHGPREKLPLTVERHRPSGDGGFIHRGRDLQRFLSGDNRCAHKKRQQYFRELNSLCHSAPPESLR